MASRTHERPEKIILAMYELSNGTTRMLKYEDIVVKSFEMFPKDFALRGYPRYPDSSDIHKPLYGPLKRRGLVRAASKTFALTPAGVEFASTLSHPEMPVAEEAKAANRLPRDKESELKRMYESAAFKFFADGKREKILDTDFYSFVGCTVRTPRNDFLGRLSSAEAAVNAAVASSHPNPESSKKLADLWSYLNEKFRPQIERRKEGR